MSEKWLVLSYFANVDGMACSHHVDDRLPFLQQQGIEVTLLSSTCGAPRKDVRHIRVAAPAPSGLRYEGRYFFRRHRRGAAIGVLRALYNVVLLPFYLLEKLFVRQDSTWSWCLSSGIAATWLTLRLRPSVIYSTGGPLCAHVGALMAARLTGTRLIVELQDPIVQRNAGEGGAEQRFNRRTERSIFRHAAAVVFLTRAAAERAASRNGRSQGVATIYPGATPAGGHNSSRTNFLVISHLGSLDGTRNLGTTLAAIELVLRRQPQLGSALRLRLYGSCGDGVRAQVAEFPVPNIIESKGKIDRAAGLQVMRESDVLLLIQNLSGVSEETIPSKVYEYLHTGRPILALVFRNPELKAMLQALEHTVVEGDDVEAVAGALESLALSWQQGAIECTPTASPYTVERAAAELAQIIQQSTTGQD